MEIGLQFGALAPPISQQIQEQLNYTDDKIKKFDEDAKCLVWAYLADLITDDENQKARQRLNKKIVKHLNSIKNR